MITDISKTIDPFYFTAVLILIGCAVTLAIIGYIIDEPRYVHTSYILILEAICFQFPFVDSFIRLIYGIFVVWNAKKLYDTCLP